MTGPDFEFKAFLIEFESLEVGLNELGKEGWRLHSCDLIAQSKESGLIYSVVMDRVIPDNQARNGGGIKMKG